MTLTSTTTTTKNCDVLKTSLSSLHPINFIYQSTNVFLCFVPLVVQSGRDLQRYLIRELTSLSLFLSLSSSLPLPLFLSLSKSFTLLDSNYIFSWKKSLICKNAKKLKKISSTFHKLNATIGILMKVGLIIKLSVTQQLYYHFICQ